MVRKRTMARSKPTTHPWSTAPHGGFKRTTAGSHVPCPDEMISERRLATATHRSMGRKVRAVVGYAAAAILVSCQERPVAAPPTEPVSQAIRGDSQRAALVALYRATDGRDWVRREGWLSDEPLERWHGVRVNTTGQVTHLELARNALSGFLPPLLGTLSHLESLVLSGNALAGPLPSWLGSLTQLQVLRLDRNLLTGPIPDAIGALTRLRDLRLSNNVLTGPVPGHLGALTRLAHLDLASNHLTGGLPHNLGNLRSLAWLDISDNELSGPIAPHIGQLTSLEHLALGRNRLTGSIPVEVGGLSSLLSLSLTRNRITGTIPPELGRLASLQEIDLAINGLSGPVPPGLGRLSGTLVSLDLSWNNLSGPVPEDMRDIVGLGRLRLHENGGLCVPRTDGFIEWISAVPDARVPHCALRDREILMALHDSTGGPGWIRRGGWGTDEPLGRWHGVSVDPLSGRVRGLSLPRNNLRGTPPRALAELEQLSVVRLADNALIGSIPPPWTRLSLDTLDLRGTDLCAPASRAFQGWLASVGSRLGVTNRCKPPSDREILMTLFRTTGGEAWAARAGWGTSAPLDKWHGVKTNASGRVTSLSLAANNLRGPIPPELGGLAELAELDLTLNWLTGPMPPELAELATLRRLNLEANRLSGAMPPGLAKLATLEELRLHSNNLAGAIPPALGRLRHLKRLALSSNAFSGSIPPELASLGTLEHLDLSDNRLSGPIPPELAQLQRLVRLALRRNRLSGPIPVALGTLSALTLLDLSDNNLLGQLPGSLGDLTDLRHLSLHGNSLEGPIPSELANLPYLEWLSLANNRLSGPIPSTLGRVRTLSRLILAHNRLTGPLPAELGALTRLSTLDASSNQLTGPIPRRWAGLGSLAVLTLSDNELTGPIPATMQGVASLRHLDLSGNRLTGAIPPELGALEELRHLDLSRNLLAGGLPATLGELRALTDLHLDQNPRLDGPLPDALVGLGALRQLVATETELCAPLTQAVSDWLHGVVIQRIRRCSDEARPKAIAYLVQSVQNIEHPVPLVAGRHALLRVLVATERPNDASLPAVRATFFLDGAVRIVAEAARQPGPIPRTLRENRLHSSINIMVPGDVVRPGTELVVEIDPEGALDPALGIPGRLPESGHIALDVRSLPPLELTVVPFLWTKSPDSAVVAVADSMAAEPGTHPLLEHVRTLLPVGAMRVRSHEPVATDTNHGLRLLTQTQAIWAMEGKIGHYQGMMSGPITPDLMGGVGFVAHRVSFARPRASTIAHELGHNMGLRHAPCGRAGGTDRLFPYVGGRSGVWGYNMLRGQLVAPQRPDLMSYCDREWVSDYHFGNALRYRMVRDRGRRGTAVHGQARPTPALLLWGRVDAFGNPRLESVFAAPMPTAPPGLDGDWRVVGTDTGGDKLFDVSFGMPEALWEGGNAGSFAFAIPAPDSWTQRLGLVTLSGPKGEHTHIDRATDQPMAILRDRHTGRIRGFLDDRPTAAHGATGIGFPQHTSLEVLISRGLPGR